MRTDPAARSQLKLTIAQRKQIYLILRIKDTMLEYQQPDSDMTLREAIKEHKHNSAAVKSQTTSSGAAEEFFTSHDAVHALFGLDTSLEQEALVDTWMLFGTTIKWGQFRTYLSIEEHKEIVRSIGLQFAAIAFVRAIPNVLRVISRSRKMTKKWPWSDHERYLDSNLRDLRRNFNVDLIV